eukprot:CAMPEP_0195152024 /NCGR_PEP_ID=MMETSP0448-20130528/181643_1 /TAXON_ID=66468 /ORGANISM="Heterocapsa triquestra, Strain CCMP 448" /LENGTH=46 /DNA_ID= /DNA_START= /DNA_END= /DNA_ORIENTATION=
MANLVQLASMPHMLGRPAHKAAGPGKAQAGPGKQAHLTRGAAGDVQ